MKKLLLQHKNLNKGNPTHIYHCLPDEEFEGQFSEIFNDEQYKKGRRRNSTYIDLGANIGLAYHYFKDYAKEYFAYEPNPELYECLLLNTKGCDNIKTYNLAVSNLDGKETLYKTKEDSPAQVIVPDTKPIGSMEVESVSMETIFTQNNIKKCDVLKIDIEGYEFMVLPSKSFGQVASLIDFIIGEGHFLGPVAFPEFIPKILEEYGYTTRFLKSNNLIRKMFYNEQGRSKEYSLSFPTMFYAERKVDKNKK